MKNAFFLALLAAIFLSGCGFSANEQVAACQYEGQQYLAGDTFAASDSCNTCSCQNDGEVVCTSKLCEADPSVCQEDTDCLQLGLDQTFCENGEWTCVNAQCQFFCDIGGSLAP